MHNHFVYANTATMTAREQRTTQPTHELVRLTKGDLSLRHLASGEVMHSNVGPRDEARLLYIEQSRLADRLFDAAGPKQLVLFDVGLGAATNALAALQCHRALGDRATSTLRIVSFENDVSGLRLAFENREHLPYFEGLEPAVQTLLERGAWQGEGLLWELLEGDFLENIDKAPTADIVFFDFYSPRTAPSLWSVEVFQKTRDKLSAEAALYTYSASTRVRAALFAAGFFVGYGRSTGMKTDTTAASMRLTDLERPLDERWLERFRRSDRPLPNGWPADRRNELLSIVERHPQFETL